MKINFKKFDEIFPFCINSKILLFFSNKEQSNEKFITLEMLLKRFNSMDLDTEGFIYSFLNDNLEIDITPEKIKNFIKRNKICREEVAYEIVENITIEIFDKLSKYLSYETYTLSVKDLSNRLLSLPADRFYNAIYQIILAQLEE